ncbi:MAG: DUF429 domain-containing protein [Candidatus Njordarchaeia archaeon]
MNKEILGLDLAANPMRFSGFCILHDNELISLGKVKSDIDILDIILEKNFDIVSIDAPLSFPKEGNLRPCDYLMMKLGFKPLTFGLKTIKDLTKRAIILKEKISNLGITVIETFPFGILKLIGYRKKPRRKNQLNDVFKKVITAFNIKVAKKIESLTIDEIDSLLCAIAGYYYLLGSFIKIESKECSVVFPILQKDKNKSL